MTGRERRDEILRLPLAQREAQLRVWLRDVVDAELRKPSALPPMPSVARTHAEAVAARVRGERVDREDASDNTAAAQHELWFRELQRKLDVDGVQLLEELFDADERHRFEMFAARLESQVRALRLLELPWWPVMREDRRTRRRWNFVEWLESELGRLNTATLREYQPDLV